MIRAYTHEYIFLLMLIGVLEFTVSSLTGHNFQRVFVGLYIELLLKRSEVKIFRIFKKLEN